MFVFDWASYGSWSATWSRCGCSAVMCLQESVVPPSICWNMQALVLRAENRAGRLRAIQLSGSREMTTGICSGGNPTEIPVRDSQARSEEHRVGKGGGSTCRSEWSAEQ